MLRRTAHPGRAGPGRDQGPRPSTSLPQAGHVGDRLPNWVGSVITDRSEATRDHLDQRAGSRAQGHRQAHRPKQHQPTSRQLPMRLAVADRQHRAGHARDPNPPGRGPGSPPAASRTADRAWLWELPALTLPSLGRRWMAQHIGLVVPDRRSGGNGPSPSAHGPLGGGAVRPGGTPRAIDSRGAVVGGPAVGRPFGGGGLSLP
jgi:hypothetical protein